jgi:hypothetical protein
LSDPLSVSDPEVSSPGADASTTGTTGWTALVADTADPSGPCYVNNPFAYPEVVFVILANRSIACAQMMPPDFPNGCNAPFEWEVCIPIHPSLLVVGSVDIATSAGDGFADNAGGCPGECCSSGTKFDQGTLEIGVVEASTVTFTLSGTVGYGVGGTVMANGTYTALRCP